MTDLTATPTEIVPARKISGRVSGVFEARAGDFITAPASSLELTFDGIVGDHHAGQTRMSGGREPWYPRGTEMRNERQLSILASDELQGNCDWHGALGTQAGMDRWQYGHRGCSIAFDAAAAYTVVL